MLTANVTVYVGKNFPEISTVMREFPAVRELKTIKQKKTIKIRECFQTEKEVGIIRCIPQDSSRKKMVSSDILEAESSEEVSYERWIQHLEMTRERSSNTEEIVSVP